MIRKLTIKTKKKLTVNWSNDTTKIKQDAGLKRILQESATPVFHILIDHEGLQMVVSSTTRGPLLTNYLMIVTIVWVRQSYSSADNSYNSEDPFPLVQHSCSRSTGYTYKTKGGEYIKKTFQTCVGFMKNVNFFFIGDE
jgi:hypothetical protein